MAARPVPASPGPRERRVRFGHLALAVALVVVGALGTTTLVALAAADGEYLAVVRDIAYGAEIADADVVPVRISNPPGVSPVPAADRERVVGNYATMSMPAGTLLTAAHVTGRDQREPGAGEIRLGITLRTDRLPGRPVQPGHRILLVNTAESGSATGRDDGDRSPAAPHTWEAVVVGVADDGSGGLLGGGRAREITIDVIVPAGDGPTIAALAAANDLALAVLPGSPDRPAS